MLIYLPTEELIFDLHDEVLEISRGKSGVRDAGVVHAAVNRPKTYLAYHPDCDLDTVCAVILQSIVKNHAFIDANKRTGLLSALLTYELNGVAMDRRADKDNEFEQLALDVVDKRLDIPDITVRLRKLRSKYKKTTISKFVEAIKKFIVPYDSDK